MSRFIKNVLKLGSATAIAQLLGVLLIPVITRIYSPADFGINQIFLSTVLIIGAVSCLSYQLSILLPKTDREAAHIAMLCFYLIITISIVAGASFWLCSDWIEGALNVPGFSRYIFLLPIGIFFHGFALMMSLWLSRRVRFGTIAVSKVASSISNKVVQIGFGLVSASPLGLIAGSLANDASFSAVMLKGFRNDLHFFRNVSFSEMRALAERYKKFPLFSTGSTLSNVASVNVASYMLAYFFGPIVVGYYSIAFTVVKLPAKLIGDALGDVFFQKASEERRLTGDIRNVVQQVHRRLISIGIFPFLVLIVIGEDLFSIFLGVEWSIAGLYAKILAPWIFLIFISAPLNNVFNVLEKQGVSFAFNVSILVSRVAALYIGGIYGNPVTTLLLFSGTGVVFWGWMNMYIIHSSEVNVKDSITDIIRFLLIGCVFIIPLIIGKYLNLGSLMLLVLAVGVALLYYLVIVFEDVKLREEFTRIIRGIQG
ncbi:o-antigen flippase wzx [hydrocarbon metagenome]|uniref:O-antigen flippase wzx n=1 Tax=hydrocarbon metagenome TaxID=938273 RepID=A0A0W8FDF5_9ZZZZ